MKGDEPVKGSPEWRRRRRLMLLAYGERDPGLEDEVDIQAAHESMQELVDEAVTRFEVLELNDENEPW